jgi:gamma-glutamyl-gamma-aminobutyrate hydrolase PuuD
MNAGKRVILVSQRVAVDPATGERRDALDQHWHGFLHEAGFLPVPVPNRRDIAKKLAKVASPHGILLTGGNDLANLGGDVPERDETEVALIAHARRHRVPLIGVCRGMQMIQQSFGVPIYPVDGHVVPRQTIAFRGGRAAVNSFHRFGTHETLAPLDVCGRSDDGVVKAVCVRDEPILGIMWHPERLLPYRAEDVRLFRDHFDMRR